MGVCLYTGFWVKLIEPDLEVLTKLVLYTYVPMQRLELSLRACMHKQQQLRKITYAIERILNGEDHYHVLCIHPSPQGIL